MAAKKRKMLPKDFEQLLKAGDLAALQAVFDTCELDARGGYAKQTALAFTDCPEALMRWLVSQGADLHAVDTWGNTPLHSRARIWAQDVSVLLELGADVHATASIGTPLHAAAACKHAINAGLLLTRGAEVDARNRDGMTPLELALSGCSNVDLERMPAFVQVLLDAGATPPAKATHYVQRIGETFEFHREGFNRDLLAAASAGLDYLYATFAVTPVPRRRVHDGTSPIAVTATTWQAQHEELWNLLVPGRGPARTVQGEVIRIAGRISDEWFRNGGGNWDKDYAAMGRALATHVQRGNPLTVAEVAEIQSIVGALSRSGGVGTDRLAELAVAWVLRNVQPIALETPSYRR